MNLTIRTLAMTLGLGTAVLMSSCSRETPMQMPEVIAQVGSALITSQQVQQKLAEKQRLSRLSTLTAVDRDAALEELVQFEALLSMAQHAGWHTNAELLLGFQRAVVGRFREEQRSKAVSPAEGEIRDYYQQHAAQFTRPERTRGAVILLETPAKPTPEKRAEAWARAAEIRAQAAGEAAGQLHFGLAAQRFSIDQATRYAGGDFGLLTRTEVEGRYGVELARALAALQSPGEISPVVQTPRGLGLVKLVERVPESRRPLAEVRESIIHQLTNAKQAEAEREFLAAARSKVEVRINRALLEAIPLPTRQDAPPAMPGTENAQVKH